MTPNDAEKLTRLIVRALQDEGPEADAAITIARDIARRSPDFRPHESIVVMTAAETGKWQQAQTLLTLGDKRLSEARRYRDALHDELEAILAPKVVEKMKRKAEKAALV